MRVSEYIASGILDVYVLGGLPANEKNDVEKMAELYPEIAAEIEGIRRALEKAALENQVEPPSHIRSNVLDAIPDEPSSVQLEHAKERMNFFPFAIAASWLIIVGLTGLSYYYRSQWKDTQSKLVAMETQRQQMAEQFNVTKFDYKEATKKIQLLSDTSYKRIPLKKLPNGKDAFAQVFWNPTQGQVFIDAKDLPLVPRGKQYQLWAIVNGKPVDAGMIPQSGEVNWVEMKTIQRASAFAITLEQQGGSPIPTLEQMYVMGGV